MLVLSLQTTTVLSASEATADTTLLSTTELSPVTTTSSLHQQDEVVLTTASTPSWYESEVSTSIDPPPSEVSTSIDPPPPITTVEVETTQESPPAARPEAGPVTPLPPRGSPAAAVTQLKTGFSHRLATAAETLGKLSESVLFPARLVLFLLRTDRFTSLINRIYFPLCCR